MTMKYITGIILLFYSCVLYGQNRVVTISDQGTFDDINSYIETAKKDKIEKLTFVFEDGLYRFNDENSINIDKNSTTELYFEARNDGKVHIMSAGEVYTKDEGEYYSSTHYRVRLKKPLTEFCTYVDQDLKSVLIADTGYLNDTLHTNISLSQIEIIGEDKMTARIRIPEELSSLANKSQSFFKNSLICYKSQWSDCYRPVLRSDSKWIYFSLNEWLAARTASYVTNMFRWTKGIQPFFITNIVEFTSPTCVSYDDAYIYIPNEVSELYVNRHGKFMTINNSKKRVKVSGLNFCGSVSGKSLTNIGGLPWNYSNALIDYLYSIGGIDIMNCKISNNGSGLMHVCSSKDISITQNHIVDNHNQRVLSTIGNNEIVRISGNYINNPNPDLTRIMCVSINDTKSVRISENDVVNVSRSFIDLGHNIKDVVITDNLVHNTNEVNDFPVRRLSSDTGVLLYSWGDCEFLAKNNVIFNLPRNFGYHGIMVDEGTGNAKIVGNLLYDIGDKCVYNWYNPSRKDTNHDNELVSNILIGDVSYGGYKRGDPNNSSYKNNILIKGNPEKVLIESKATDLGGNMFIDKYNYRSDKLYVPKSIYRRIYKSDIYSGTIKERLKKIRNR